MDDKPESDASNSNDELTQHQINASIIYNADHIMKTILENVHRYQDRFKLMRVSYRFQELLDKTLKPPNVRYETLYVAVVADGTAQTLLGSFSKTTPCLTQGSSRNLEANDPQNNQQTEELMTVLQKLSFAKNNMKYVTLGGGGSGYCYDELGITGDLIEYIDQLPNLETLNIQWCDFKNSGIQRIMSEDCKFKHKIQHLSLRGTGIFSYIVEMINTNLRTLSIQRLPLDQSSILLDRINELGIHLDKMTFKITFLWDVDVAVELLTNLSRKCAKFHLIFISDRYSDPRRFLQVLRNIDTWENITALNISTSTFKPEDYAAKADIFTKISNLIHLESLTISEYFSPTTLQCLANAVGNLTKLKYLRLVNRSPNDENYIGLIIENLSSPLEAMELGSIDWRRNLEETICNKFSNTLKYLNVSKTRWFTSPNFFTAFVTRLHALEKLHYHDPIPWELLHYVIENKQIDSFDIAIRQGLPSRVEVILQDHFVNFRTYYFDSCHVACSNRKPSLLTLPLEPFDLVLLEDGKEIWTEM